MANPQWTIELNDGAYVFPVTTRRTIRDRQEIRPDGTTDYREALIAVEGLLTPDPGTPNDQIAENVTDKFIELREILFSPSPLIVELKLDGVTKHRFDPADGLGTPKCRELVELPEGAVEVTSVRFNCTFWMKTPTRESPNDQLTDLRRDIEEIYDANGLIQQKTWKATATGTTLNAAKARVLSFKPKIKPLAEQYVESPDELRFTATWTWRVGIDDSITTYTESVLFESGGASPVAVKRIGKEPALFSGRLSPGRLIVTIEVEGTDPAKIVEPTAHLTPSQTTIRATDQERPEPLRLARRAEGIYRAVFQEVWIVLGATAPTLDHSDHADPFKHATIPNGPIGGSQGGLNK